MTRAPAWYARHEEGGNTVIRAYESTRYPPATTVDVAGDSEPEDGEFWVATVALRGDDRQVLSIRVAPSAAEGAPPLWYVSLPEHSAQPPAMNLVAFTAPLVADGTVVDSEHFSRLPVRNDEQVASIRWWPSTGVIHQIYVVGRYRRRHIGRKMVVAAAAYSVGSGWAQLRAGGERTDLGEVWAGKAPEHRRERVAPRTRVLPPMTPEGEARGLPDRLLYPDPD